MRPLTLDEVRFLISHEDGPCLSLYLPTRRGGGADDRQRYAGLVRRARELLAGSYPKAKADSLCDPLDKLAKDEELWRSALDGLCVFRSDDVAVYYRLPVAFEELAVAADSFHIRPLLRYLQSNERYFLLNLAQGRVSLFKGSAMGLGPIDLATLPRTMADALGFAPGERSVQFHAGGPRGSAPVYHGSGREDSVRDEELLQFLRSVDRALWDVLRDETAPLVLATTPRMAAAFEKVARYPHLLHEHVAGSYANAKLEELHARSWPLVQAHAAQREVETARRYGNLISAGRALDDASTIARFAVQGRVRDLLLERGAALWGRMDRTTGAVDIHRTQRDAHDDDLLDDIAEAVLLRGGDVVTLPRERMPSRSPVAAILRW
jgi:hypothetical protein